MKFFLVSRTLGDKGGTKMNKKVLRIGILICGIAATVFLASGPARSTSDNSQHLRISSQHAAQTAAAFQSRAYILLAGRGYHGNPIVRDHRSSGSDSGAYTFGQGGGMKQTPVVSKGNGEGGVWVTPSGSQGSSGNQGSTYSSGGPYGGGSTVRDHRHP
jgi:hypothetical protein